VLSLHPYFVPVNLQMLYHIMRCFLKVVLFSTHLKCKYIPFLILDEITVKLQVNYITSIHINKFHSNIILLHCSKNLEQTFIIHYCNNKIYQSTLLESNPLWLTDPPLWTWDLSLSLAPQYMILHPWKWIAKHSIKQYSMMKNYSLHKTILKVLKIY